MNVKNEFKGIIPPMITTFSENHRLDEEKQRNFINYLINQGNQLHSQEPLLPLLPDNVQKYRKIPTLN